MSVLDPALAWDVRFIYLFMFHPYNMTCRQMIGVGVRNMVLARGELDRLEGPGYAARRTELRRKAKEAARTRDRQAAASQDEAEENDATEEE